MGLISRSGIVPLFLRNDVAGPICRTVEDATRVLEIMAGVDENDPITKHAVGKIPDNYTQYLQKEGLENARIGVLRQINTDEIDPEINALFNKAINDLKAMGAQIIDSLSISGIRENYWCPTFKNNIESYLATYIKNDTLKTLEDIIRIGTLSKFTENNLKNQLNSNNIKSEYECLDTYTDPRLIAFRKSVENYMDQLELDAIIYPTWNVKPAKTTDIFETYADGKGNNSSIIAPHTGQPAFTVPMGFTNGNLPIGLEFLGRMYSEPVLIKLAYAYEQGTKHRVPPNLNRISRTKH